MAELITASGSRPQRASAQYLRHKAQLHRALIARLEDIAIEAGIAEIASDARIDDMTGTAFHTAYGFAEAERVACFVRKVGR